MENIFKRITENLSNRIYQYLTSMLGGLLVAFESSIPFFIPCLIVTLLDIYSANCLGRRLHKKYPDKADGKFKSEYKYRVMHTLFIALVVLILGAYVDILIFKEGNRAVCSVFGFFMFYQGWSVLENCSSENDKPWAKLLQRIMVNKAERHLNIELEDILLKKDKEE